MEKRAVKCPKCQQVMHILSLPEDREIGCIKCKKILKVPGIKKGKIDSAKQEVSSPIKASQEPSSKTAKSSNQSPFLDNSRNVKSRIGQYATRLMRVEWTPMKVYILVLAAIWCFILLLYWSSEAWILISQTEIPGHAPAPIRIVAAPFLALMIPIGIALYAAPTTVAFLRYHKNAVPVFLVNVFFGWTFIGWVAALIWSFTDNTHSRSMP